jgi:hypothetical protein
VQIKGDKDRKGLPIGKHLKAVLERQHYEIAEKNLQHLKQTFLSLHQNQKKHKKDGCGHNLMSVTHNVSGHHLHHE